MRDFEAHDATHCGALSPTAYTQLHATLAMRFTLPSAATALAQLQNEEGEVHIGRYLDFLCTIAPDE